MYSSKKSEDEQVERLLKIKPSARQISWQKTEFYGFIHFNINTFTGKQWGDGNESPSLFNPDSLNTDQWVYTLKRSGMKGLILTCKHHDGFCLWPSDFTEHTVASSPWKEGRGDLVRDVSESCRKYGLKFGIYISPWDRHDTRYGQGDNYNDFFVSQLKELLTQYGPIFSVWLDGARGDDHKGKIQTYDWERYYSVIRRLQPEACISVCGPDVRWCGNESGRTREEEWSVVPAELRNVEKIQKASQTNEDHQQFISLHSSEDTNLGSREVVKNAQELVWYPCEVNTSIRPSWFYTESEDGLVKSAEALFNLYIKTVGGNSTLLLNVPPDRRGRIHESDTNELLRLGCLIREAFCNEKMIKREKITASSDNNKNEEYVEMIELEVEKRTPIKYLVLQEDITEGQRIENFQVAIKIEEEWQTVYSGKTIGYKSIVKLNPHQCNLIRIIINKSRGIPLLTNVKVY